MINNRDIDKIVKIRHCYYGSFHHFITEEKMPEQKATLGELRLFWRTVDSNIQKIPKTKETTSLREYIEIMYKKIDNIVVYYRIYDNNFPLSEEVTEIFTVLRAELSRLLWPRDENFFKKERLHIVKSLFPKIGRSGEKEKVFN